MRAIVFYKSEKFTIPSLVSQSWPSTSIIIFIGSLWSDFFSTRPNVDRCIPSVTVQFYFSFTASEFKEIIISLRSIYRHGMCFRMSYVFVSSILFWFPQCTRYFLCVFRFLFLERKQDSNVTFVKNVQGCF